MCRDGGRLVRSERGYRENFEISAIGARNVNGEVYGFGSERLGSLPALWQCRIQKHSTDEHLRYGCAFQRRSVKKRQLQCVFKGYEFVNMRVLWRIWKASFNEAEPLDTQYTLNIGEKTQQFYRLLWYDCSVRIRRD